MDPADLRLEFLDLKTASESEKQLIDRILHNSESDLSLPWGTDKQEHVDEGVELEGSEGPLEDPPTMATDPHAEWVQHRYDEPEVGVGEQVPPVPRNQVVSQYVFYPVQYLPHQPYPYPEMDMQSGRGMLQAQGGGRPLKKGDKKLDQQQQPQPVPYQPPHMQMVVLPHMYHHPFIQPVPLYTSEYHAHAHPHYPAYPEDYSSAPPPPVPVEMVPPPPAPIHVKHEPSIPIQKEHEHICQHTEVTVSAPKKKHVEEPQPPAPVLESAPAPPSPEPVPVEPVESVEMPVAPMSVAAPAKTAAPVTRKEPVAAVHVDDVAAPKRSYAQLFTQDSKPRPLARVPPFDLSSSAVVNPLPVLSPVPADKVAPVNFSNHHHVDYKITEDPYTVRLGEFLKNYQLDHRAVSLTPRGLTNRSNWCYVNAVLQALIACPSFVNLLKALPAPQDPKQASRTPIIGAMIDLAQSFPPLAAATRPKRRDKQGREEASDLPSCSSFEPTGVYKVLDKVKGDSSLWVEGRQEDAEEFLSCLLNGLNDEMFEVAKLMGGIETEVTNGDAGSETETEMEGWKVMGPKNKGAVTRRAVCGKTLISDMFRGQVRSRVQRTGGEHTDNFQPFFTLQLDIEKVGSVKDALDLLAVKDSVEGMTCSKTHQEIEAYRQTTLEDLPLVLILHLKCFDYKSDGCSKIIKTVDFPIDLKIEAKLMTSTKNKYTAKQKCYKLVAVVYHEGKEASKGHYVTDAYHVGLACWIRYDDGNVQRVSEEKVLKPAPPRMPYLLYYRRADTMSHIKT